MKHSDYVTLILAGGEGSRLGVLTKQMPKPTVPFGGVHRLIDFTLSNCKHSQTGVTGVITQYRGGDIADYIGCGSQWLSENGRAKITMLPPKTRNGITEPYTGTADAILKNADFIEQHNPQNVLVLSCDHVYKMNYARMIKQHLLSGAVATISSVDVPLSEASRFGVIVTNKKSEIIDFEEKPANPKSYLASMGVYIFNWPVLKRYLTKACAASESGVDIGRDIIPAMLVAGERLSAHRFHGYWRDVGSVYSLWEANMELLSDSPGICLHEENWKIIGRNKSGLLRHKHFRTHEAYVTDSIIAEASIVKGTVSKSVVSYDVVIGEDARIVDSVIMPGVSIGRGAVVIKAIVGADAVLADYTSVGGVKPDGTYLDNNRGVSVVGSGASVFTNMDGRLKVAALHLPEAYAV